MTKWRVILADDHGVVREGLKMLINAQADLEVIAEASNGADALEMILRLRPDVAIIDISMPILNGIELAARLRGSGTPTRLLALTANEDRAYLQQLLQMGATGYLLKRSAADELNQAIRIVAAGGSYLDPTIASEIGKGRSSAEDTAPISATLSDREDEVIRLIAQGFSHKEIAVKLDLSVKTVETYKSRSTQKLGLRGRSDIVRYAISQGWLRSD